MGKLFRAFTRGNYLSAKRWALKYIILILCLVGIFGTLAPAAFSENPWRIWINLPEFRLYLYNGDNLYHSYEVAVGKPGTASPVGDFWIINKIVDPTWYPPHGGKPIPAGPDNPLGKYWMGLNIKGYGIHGNSAPYSIGASVSLGCFRMHNTDIEQLFRIVPAETPVRITYTTVRGTVDENQDAWLEVFPDIYNWMNQEETVQETLSQLNWSYEPHQKALQQLLNAKKPLKVEVPRTVKLDGDLPGVDAFYWNGSVYISKGVLKILQVTNDINDPLFTDYLKIETVMSLTGSSSNYYWNQNANTLKIIRLKENPDPVKRTNP